MDLNFSIGVFAVTIVRLLKVAISVYKNGYRSSIERNPDLIAPIKELFKLGVLCFCPVINLGVAYIMCTKKEEDLYNETLERYLKNRTIKWVPEEIDNMDEDRIKTITLNDGSIIYYIESKNSEFQIIKLDGPIAFNKQEDIYKKVYEKYYGIEDSKSEENELHTTSSSEKQSYETNGTSKKTKGNNFDFPRNYYNINYLPKKESIIQITKGNGNIQVTDMDGTIQITKGDGNINIVCTDNENFTKIKKLKNIK